MTQYECNLVVRREHLNALLYHLGELRLAVSHQERWFEMCVGGAEEMLKTTERSLKESMQAGRDG